MTMVSTTLSSAMSNAELIAAVPDKIIRVVQVAFTSWGAVKLSLLSDPGPDPQVILPSLHISNGRALVLRLGRGLSVATHRGKALGFNTQFQAAASEYTISVWYEVVNG